MGARAQVLVQDGEEKVYLYTHWGAGNLAISVKETLQSERGRNRLGDMEYLARAIFEDMIGDENGTETGYGIGVTEHGDIEMLVTVDVDKKTVSIDDRYYPKMNRTVSVEEFING